MSISYTHTTLVAAITSFAEDNDTEFVAHIDDFIGKAETRLLRDLDLELFEAWQTITVSGGNREVTKPTDAIVINDLWIRNPGTLRWIELPRRSFEYVLSYAPVEGTVGVPDYYSEFDQTKIYVVPTPDQSYSGGNARVRATIRPARLSSSQDTSWLGDNVGDLLFQACMVEAYDFLKHEPAMIKAANKYQSLTPGVVRELEDIMRKAYKGLNKEKKKGADD